MQLLLYGSTTGNTEALAWFITKNTKNKTTCLDVNNVSTSQLQEATTILLGASTWGGEDNDPLIQEDMDYFLAENLPNLTNKNIILFGCGDRYYPAFCGALDVIENLLKSKSTVLQPILRIQDPWTKYQQDVLNWINLLGI